MKNFKNISLIKILLEEFIFFLIGFLLVLAGFYRLKKISTASQIISPEPFRNEGILPFIFLLYLILLTLLIYFIVKYFKKPRKPLLFFYYLAIFSGINFYLGIFAGINLKYQLFATLIAVFLTLLRHFFPLIIVQNLVFIITLSGISLFFAKKISLQNIIILLLVIAIYDFIAVFVTKHMIFIGKKLAELGIGLFLILPLKLKDLIKSQRFIEIKPYYKKFLILGGGDIGFPLILIASLLNESFLKALFVFLFSLLGIFSATYIFFILKKPVPALPPIVFLSLVGYILSKFLP